MDANEALKRLEQATAEAAKVAQDHLDRGLLPEAAGFHLAEMTEGLPEEVKVAQMGALGAGLSDEDLKKLPPDLVARITAAHQPPPAAST